MRLSSFNVYVEQFPEPGQTLVYNTFSGGSVVLDASWVSSARAAGGAVDAAECDPALGESDLGVVVESKAVEEREFAAWLRGRKESGRVASALVSVSYACNLACTYCLQESVMSGRTMPPEVADDTARFFVERVRELGSEQLEITFIGGEPLLHPHLIERIASAVKAGCEPLGVRFGFQLITNGTLLFPDVVRRLVACGLTQVQVTIDGDECSHGLTRVDKRGRNTFHETWANVLACIDLVPISLQGNFTDANVFGFVPLLERMKRDGVDPARVPRIKFKPALDFFGTPEDAGVDSCTWSNAKPEVQIALGDAVRAFGYTPHDHIDIGPCVVHMQHHWSVGPEGLVWKCPGFVGKPEWATGSVKDGLAPKHRSLTLLANTRSCGDCTFRPVCAGGCVAAEWVRTGVPEDVNCERRYFETVGVDVIKRNYYLDTLPPDEAEARIRELPGRVELPRHAPAPSAPTSPSTRSEARRREFARRPEALVSLRTPPRAPHPENRP